MNPVHMHRQTPAARLLAGLALAALAHWGLAQAQTRPFPVKPLTLVSPFAGGGTSDAVARVAARLLEKEMGQPVVVLNKPGAGGTIGMASILAAPVDGYSVVMGGLGSVVFPAEVYKSRLKYDPARDLTPLGILGVAPTVILARAGLPAQNLKELVAYAKAHPGQVSYASAGVGGSLHLAGVLFEREAGLKLNHVPYKGGAPAMTDLAGGSVDLAFADLTLAMPFLKSGRVRALAVASGSRLPGLPDVPTTAESGFAGVKVDTWYALFAPTTAPAVAIERWQAALDKVRDDPAMVNALSAQSIVPVSTPLPQFKAQLAKDFETWLPLVRQACAASGCD